MRCRFAKLLAVATGFLVVFLSIVFALVQAEASQVPADRAGQLERGKAVYREQQCQACHSIAGVGSKRYPLDGVGSTLASDDIRKWIVAPREMNPRVVKRAFDKLPKTDLDALVAYLTSLQKR
jgi:mono/diheme cytochrome c family protein